MSGADPQRYLHLLSEQDMRDLRPLLQILREGRDSVLSSWYERYLDHFREAVTLSKPAFLQIFGGDIDACVENLLDGDLDGFEADMRALGLELVERGVPFAEIIASLHLFEESATEKFAAVPQAFAQAPSLYGTFDKLSHCRIILLADAYFAGYRRETTTRIAELEEEASRLAEGPARRTRFHGLIGASPAMARVYEQIAAAAGGRGAVFVCGESGTGKELVARAVHEAAGRPERPFIAINCAALPRELVESELFGHRKGAYTGAQTEYLGLIRSASGGTLFLDEITEMAGEIQAKLLRVIEEHAVRPVGGTRELPVDVRFIASTNRDPGEAVEQKRLRSDLFYRLNVHQIAIPPLRERLEDVPLLVAHFTQLLGGRGLREVQGVDEEAMRVLLHYLWPGNVRELRSAVEYGLSLGKNAQLRKTDLPPHILAATLAASGIPSAADAPAATPIPTLEEVERALIVRALETTGGNKLKAAGLLQISRHRLYDKLRKYGIDP